MYQSINVHQFREAFKSMGRTENFSYRGLEALYDFLEELAEDTGQEIELDVISLCCDFSELSVEEVITEYPDLFDQDIIGKLDDEDKMEIVLEALQEETMVIPIDDERLIIQAF